MGSDSQLDLFLSYAGDDRESIARPLVRAIRRAGLSVWYDEIDSPLERGREHPSEDIEAMLGMAIDRVRRAWLLVGPSYNRRQWTRWEAAKLAALADHSTLTGTIYHGISEPEVRGVLAELGMASKGGLVRYEGDPSVVARHLAKSVERGVTLTMMRHQGPIDIVVFEQVGQVFLFTDGGIGEPEHGVWAYDLCGHRIGEGPNMDGLLNTFLDARLEEGGSIEVGQAGALARIESHDAVTLGFLSHPNQKPYTDEDVALGVFQRIGDLFLIPMLTYGPMTIAEITSEAPAPLVECLETIKKAGIDQWSRIQFRDDGTFTVQ